MMKDLLKQNPHCDNGDDIVAYIYNEMTKQERVHFDSHLVGCESCRREMGEMTFASDMVKQWRVSEFDSLSTPIIHVHRPITDNQIQEVHSPGWLSILLEMIRFPKIATVGLAFGSVMLAIVLVGTVFFFDLGSDKIAMKDNPVTANSDDALSVMTNNRSGIDPDQDRISNNSPTANTSNDRSKNVKIIVNHSKINRSNNPRPVRVNRIEGARKVSYNSVNAPTLSEFEEYRDESLRLSDLMDDFEGSDAS